MRPLFVLRPQPGASQTADRARELGLSPIAMPLFAVEPIEWVAPDPAEFDALLVTSANAIRHGGRGLNQLRSLPVYAVGEATAAAAGEAGFQIAETGSGGVESLLAQIPGVLRLLHLCGEHYRTATAEQSLTSVPVYRSAELPMPQMFRDIAGAVVLVHSGRAGSRLASLTDAAGLDRSTVAVAAISAQAAEAAGEQWQLKEWPAQPTDEALLALAARLCHKLD